MPRYINDIIIHCTATPAGKDLGAADIKAMHIDRGWRTIGYHYIIKLDGTIERGRAISQPGAHCFGHNAHSIGIAYIGGLDAHGRPADTRTPEQKAALLHLVGRLIKVYHCRAHGHNNYANKACPCYNATSEYASLYNQLASVY